MGSGFLKAKWYERLMLRGTLVSLIPSKEHAARRKHFSKALSQQNLLEWEPVIKSKIAFRIAAMKSEGQGGDPVDILMHFTSMATEVVVELCYGDATDPEQSAARNALVQGIQSELLLPQSERFKNLPFGLRCLPLSITRLILRSFGPPINNSRLTLFEKYREGKKQTLLSKALAENASGADGALPWSIIIKEALAFLVAGRDTTAVTATYLIWAVLKHPEVHDRLKDELTNKLDEECTISDIQSLPYLHCVIQETLRLYGAVSTALQRTAPQGGCQVGEVFVPEGTTVTTQAFTMHRNLDIFDDPLRYCGSSQRYRRILRRRVGSCLKDGRIRVRR
jgi:cytochrome P450